jgi:hypothetical protein
VMLRLDGLQKERQAGSRTFGRNDANLRYPTPETIR